jgi:hypothetical protein
MVFKLIERIEGERPEGAYFLVQILSLYLQVGVDGYIKTISNKLIIYSGVYIDNYHCLSSLLGMCAK